jgi:hypothetical protein
MVNGLERDGGPDSTAIGRSAADRTRPGTKGGNQGVFERVKMKIRILMAAVASLIIVTTANAAGIITAMQGGYVRNQSS